MEERNKSAKKVGIFGIIGNIFLFIIKIIVGLASKSNSMIADSFNSAGDIFASFMTWIGNRISSVPNDDDHQFGHGKAEYIFSMLISISMMIIAIKLLFDAVISLINHATVNFSINLIIVCIVTIITKLCLFLYAYYSYQKYDNLLVKSNMYDHRNDMVITSFTLIAALLSKYQIYWFDGIVGIGISLWIFWVGVKIFRESYDVLMDTAIDGESKKDIIQVIKKYDAIRRIGNIYSIPIGYKYIVVVTILVDGKMNTSKSHDITDEIEEEILQKIKRIEKVIIHVEPYTIEEK